VFAVHILTTDGPVAIQRISEEDPVVSSVICLDGRAQALPISPAYDAFVRNPVGVIEKMTGHAAYRMDVSSRIDEGRSWQLAAYIAHVAARQPDAGPMQIYASGEIDSDLRVRSVEYVDLKLAALAQALPKSQANQQPAIILVPAQDAPLPEHINGIPVYAVSTVEQALALVGLNTPEQIDATEKLSPGARFMQMKSRATVVLILLSVLIFWVGGDLARWSALMEQGRILDLEEALIAADQSAFKRFHTGLYRQWLAFNKPGIDSFHVDGDLIVARDEAACSDPAKRQTSVLGTEYNGPNVICAVEMRAVTEDSKMSIVGRMGYWPTGLGQGPRADRVMRGSKEASGRTWSLTFRNRPQKGAALRLVVIAGGGEIHGAQPWYQALLSSPLGSLSFNTAARRLDALGFVVKAYDWHRE